MDLENQLLLQRQSARISELEGWLALFVIMHGSRNGAGFQYKLCGSHAQDARAQLASIQPTIAVEYDFPSDRHIIDVL